MNLIINPAKPVKFNEKAIAKVIETQGSIIADIKHDGVRCELVIKPCEDVRGQPAARCYAFSRSDKLLPALRELFQSDDDRIALGQLLKESLYPDGIVIDGEMMVKGVDFQTGSGMLRRKTPIAVERLEYVIYGYLPLEHFTTKDKRESLTTANCVMQAQIGVLVHQVKELLPALSWGQVTSYDVFDIPSLYELYEQVREAGHEGLVIKAPLSAWHRGKKVGWWKLKNEDTIDGNVISPVWGTEGKANEGLVIGFDVLLESERVVTVTGITREQMAEFTANVKNNPDYYKDWAIEVAYMEETNDKSLRHPSFNRWRGTETDPTVKS
ncbi:MAG: hypothetical protein ACRC7S_07965 [Cetobacterium sp.]